MKPIFCNKMHGFSEKQTNVQEKYGFGLIFPSFAQKDTPTESNFIEIPGMSSRVVASV